MGCTSSTDAAEIGSATSLAPLNPKQRLERRRIAHVFKTRPRTDSIALFDAMAATPTVTSTSSCASPTAEDAASSLRVLGPEPEVASPSDAAAPAVVSPLMGARRRATLVTEREELVAEGMGNLRRLSRASSSGNYIPRQQQQQQQQQQVRGRHKAPQNGLAKTGSQSDLVLFRRPAGEQGAAATEQSSAASPVVTADAHFNEFHSLRPDATC